MLPRELVDALRVQVNVSMANYGQDCTLYIPTVVSYTEAEKSDIFAKPSDIQYISYQASVFIEWQPTAYRLKKLGLYVEDNLPIIAWFGNRAIALEGSDAGSEVDISIVKQSYFKIGIESVPADIAKVSEFEIVNPSLKGMQDMEIMMCFSIAPRRVKL